MLINKKNRLLGVLLSIFFCAAAFTGCAARSVLLSSPQQDIKDGAEVASQVERGIGYYQSQNLTPLVKKVGQNLVAQLEDTPYPFQFHIVEQDEANAFALPGGYIYVSRGLLALTNNEDELAGVLGHEIIHVTKRHSAKQSARGVLPGLFSIPGRAVGRVASPAIGSLLTAPFAGAMACYSRSQENEADIDGMALAAKAGYDPKRLADILERLEQDADYKAGEKRKFSFFDSHPMTPDRASNIRKKAPARQVSTVSRATKNEQAYVQVLEGLVLGHDPAQGIFMNQTFYHPDLNFSLTFPRNWETHNNPAAVGAKEKGKNKDAIIAVALSSQQISAKAAGEKFATQLGKDSDISQVYQDEIQLGTQKAYRVAARDRSHYPAVEINVIWTEFDGRLVEFFGTGDKTVKAKLYATAKSLRRLTKEEREAVKVKRIHIVEPKQQESWEALAKRTDSYWSADYAAIANGLPQGTKLPATKKRLKVAVQEKYISSN